MAFNLSGTLTFFKLFQNPALCLPHHTIKTFADLPVPIGKAFADSEKGIEADIRAVILDKDNCFALPHSNEVYPPYIQKFEELKKAYPGSRLLIVSNTAGTRDDPTGEGLAVLEKNTGVKVLKHNTKKPGCRDEVFKYLREAPDVQIERPDQIAVVGDRLLTDVMMANLMGARGIWVKDGVVQRKTFFAKAEESLSDFLLRRGYVAPEPKSDFE
ncbi:HAD phosphatase, family IIIA [Verruconis gallopava]|uniref:HAD phosphatase, family IIIA n=1 Tax=Verruconis gallopava TaxID=253628 RepID=A0A0D2AAN0_9PEZI|nr:HAD phosphatase, family IIIA [Verruconis gallopava]KIW03833.1 HAD phosphatase, family IIIA [Verruconis gallopava]